LTEASNPAETHVTEGDLAGYLDKSLSPEKHERVERHLADCLSCRSEMITTARVIRRAGIRWFWYWGASGLAAAAVVVLLIARPFQADDITGPTLRAPEAPLDVGERHLGVIAPDDGISIARDSMLFVWRPADGETRYRYTLTNVLGEDIWSFDTADTSLVVPTQVVLEIGESYLWYVDALYRDGRSVTTGTRRFELSR
jgi:hypothetical protein